MENLLKVISKDYLEKLNIIASEEDETEQVYRLNLQLFPVSERIDNCAGSDEHRENAECAGDAGNAPGSAICVKEKEIGK